jgi:formylglycine-generating enzyme
LLVALTSTYQETQNGTVDIRDERGGEVRISLSPANSGFFSGDMTFPDALPDRSNVRQVANLSCFFFGNTASGPNVSMLASFVVESNDPFERIDRVFISDDSNAVVYDSGFLNGVMSSPVVSRSLNYQNLTTSEGASFAVYAITAVPEPSTYIMALAGLACGGYSIWWRRKHQRVGRSFITTASLALVAACLAASPAHAAPMAIDMVTVGDPGNTADTTGDPNPAGAVADAFRIMKYEWTNQQYTDFLNSVDANGTNPNSVYNTNMGSNARGGITNTGTTNGSRYATKPNMGDKPVNFVSWFDAARVSNWLMNGGTNSSSTETGAYTLTGGQTSGTAPAVNPGATFYIPTENQWYKAAYYKGGSTNAGYWNYATQSDTPPTAVTSGSTGIGSSGSTGNFANYNLAADWNSQDGNVTTVGTNGGASAYGAFDMSGNVFEWNDLTGAAGSSRGLRGGDWNFYDPFYLSSSLSISYDPSDENGSIGFRLASPVPVPEPSTWVMGLAGIACVAWRSVRRRRAR